MARAATSPESHQKPLRSAGSDEEHPLGLAARMASRFELAPPVEAFDFPEKGNINRQTFLVQSGRGHGPSKGSQEFILQRINDQVFTRPDRVMEAMLASLAAQRSSLQRGLLPKGREWDVITLIPTREGDSYLRHEDRRGASCWRLMVRIPACHTYKNLGEIAKHAEQLSVAEEAGRGMALYGDFTAGMDVSSIANPLPGYRDTALYYKQLRSVLDGNRTLEDAASLLPSDETVLHSTREHFLVALPEHEYRRRLEAPETRPYVELAQREEEFGMTLLNAMSEGRIRVVAIHGDTKLDNFLFSTRSGQAKALVDLDTIMPHTWLVDWGDMVRSLVNVAGEKERDLSKVRVDMEIYEALARGFLTTARKITPEEVSLMVEAVEVISLELGIRFLTDHLRGDTYFKLSPADPRDLNRVRGLVQLKLFERLREKSDAARQCIERWSRG